MSKPVRCLLALDEAVLWWEAALSTCSGEEMAGDIARGIEVGA